MLYLSLQKGNEMKEPTIEEMAEVIVGHGCPEVCRHFVNCPHEVRRGVWKCKDCILYFATHSEIKKKWEILNADRCPNIDCLDRGIIPVQVNGNWESQQCEFCYTNPNSLFNVKRNQEQKKEK